MPSAAASTYTCQSSTQPVTVRMPRMSARIAMTAWTAMIRRRLSIRSAITPGVRREDQHGHHLQRDDEPELRCPIRSACRRASPARSSASRCRPARCPAPRTSAGSSGSRAPRTCGARLLPGSRAVNRRAGRARRGAGPRPAPRAPAALRASACTSSSDSSSRWAARLALRSRADALVQGDARGVASTRAARRSSASAWRLISCASARRPAMRESIVGLTRSISASSVRRSDPRRVMVARIESSVGVRPSPASVERR